MARVTVTEGQKAVVFKDGVLDATYGPGRYRKGRRRKWHLVDVRPSILTLPTQEVLTKDGVQVRVSLIATIETTDATAWVIASANPFDVLYTALQVALRDRIASTDLTDLAASRATLFDGIEAEIAPAVARVGVTLSRIALKDLTFPQEVRAAIAQAALERQRGLGELEKARTEAATLRSLANSAKLMAENPMLLQLRTLQAASEGAQIIIHRESGAPES